jgi:hypothetical protein
MELTLLFQQAIAIELIRRQKKQKKGQSTIFYLFNIL